MIIAAVQNSTSWWQNLTSFNWFDIAVVGLLIFAFYRGRKNGMSREALPTAFWLVVVIGAGFGYSVLGDLLQRTGVISKVFGKSVNEHTFSCVICYLAITLVVFLIYSQLAKVFREKVSGSNAFGGGEYYLGIIAGIIRFSCILIFFLAFLNAPYYSDADIAAQKAYNNRWFGGGEKNFSGDLIPSVSEVQDSVFRQSLIGQAIKSNLGVLLIQGTATGPRAAKHS
jgi:uncharacterized membrane protein required for colicin V production